MRRRPITGRPLELGDQRGDEVGELVDFNFYYREAA